MQPLYLCRPPTTATASSAARLRRQDPDDTKKSGNVMGPFGTSSRRCKLPRAVASGVIFVLLTVAIVCGTVQAGARYFYCEGLGLSSSDPCAQGAERPESCPLDSIDRQNIDCCSVIRMPSMPDGARASAPTVPPAGVVAILPAIQDAMACSWRESLRAARANGRWRKPPRASAERRAELMVFLT